MVHSYKERISAIYEENIVNPTAAGIASLMPHLNMEQLNKLLHTDNVDVACPPLKVAGTIHVLSFTTTGNKVVLSHLQTVRSYDISDCLFKKEAIDYANREWGSRLVSNDWKGMMTYSVQKKPSSEARSWKSKDNPIAAKIYLAVSQGRTRDIKDLDSVIMMATLNPAIGAEFQASRPMLLGYSWEFPFPQKIMPLIKNNNEALKVVKSTSS
jgi:hypothetical protein